MTGSYTSKLNDAVNRALQETDAREIRKRITRYAYRGESLLGKSLDSATPSIMSNIIHATLQHAEYAGLSGEDMHTVIDGELHGVTLDPNQALKFNDRIEAEHYAPNAYEFANLDGIEFRAVEHEFMEAKIPQEASHD